MALLTAAQACDELAVRALVESFSDAVTRRRPDELRQLFAADGVWEVPGVGPTAGADAIVATLERLLEGFPFLVQLAHGTVVTLEGAAATARSTISEWARDAAGQGSHFIGVYDDRLTRSAEGWRFQSRRFRFLYRGRTDLPGRAYPYPEE